MAYLIHCGEQYVADCYSKSTTNKALAFAWHSKAKADNYLKGVNNWGGIYKHMKFELEEIDIPEKVQEPPKAKDDFCEGLKLKSLDDLFQTNSTLNIMSDFAKELEERKVKLDKMFVQLSSYRQDILHAIEFYDKLNVVQGYKLYKLLRDTQRLRRKCKNEIAVIDGILGKEFSSNSITQMSQNLDKVMNQEYKARIDKELFNGQKKGIKLWVQ